MPEIILLSSPLSPAKAHHLGQVVKSLVWTFFFPFFCKDKIFVCTSTYVAIEMGSKCGRGVALCIFIHIENFLNYFLFTKETKLIAFYNKYWVQTQKLYSIEVLWASSLNHTYPENITIFHSSLHFLRLTVFALVYIPFLTKLV